MNHDLVYGLMFGVLMAFFGFAALVYSLNKRDDREQQRAEAIAHNFNVSVDEALEIVKENA